MQFSEEQKKVITSRGKNLLVSAAAGSGKTAVLVERILSLITDGTHPVDLDRILIVTFTVAAAGEMKDRIGRALEELLSKQPDSEHLQRQTVLLHHAQINTIHAFCSYIIRNYFYRIDLDPVFRMMDEGEQKLMFGDVLRDLLEDVSAEENSGFSDFETNYFQGRTDIALEDVIEKLYRTAMATPWPKEWLRDSAAAYDDALIARIEDREEAAQAAYTAPMVRTLCALVEDLIDRFDARKREKGVCDFNDLEHLALQILYETDADGQHVRSEAAKELAGRFAYVMTDEYQDSNLIQEKILSAVSGNDEGVWNRFMVGDIKQSIYGFRQARPDIFLGKYKEYEQAGETCERIDLSTNYRSRKEVIDTVNLFFARLMIPELGGIEYDEKARLAYGNGYPEETGGEIFDHRAELILMDRKSPDMAEYGNAAGARRIEAELAAWRIRQIVGKMPVYDKDAGAYRPCRYSDIAILFRVQDGVADLFARVLQDEGIPCHTSSKKGYYAATEVAMVMNILSVLDNPEQDIPFAAVLFSPIVDLSAGELAKIRAAAAQGNYYRACRSYCAEGADAALREKLSVFLERFDRLRALVPCLAVHELIRRIYAETGYRDLAAAMPGGAQRAANLDMLAAKAKSFEETSYRGLFHFIRYIEKLKKESVDEGEVNLFSDKADTVRLMSIHKSKGLEFPVVFLCDTAHGFNTRDTSGGFQFHSDLGIGMDVRDYAKCREIKGIAKERISAHKKREGYAESLRVLYVALTRAREKLIITGVAQDLDNNWKDCAERGLKPEDAATEGMLLEGGSFLDWIMLAVSGTEHPSLWIRTVTPTMLSDELLRQDVEQEETTRLLTDPDPETVYDADTRALLGRIREYAYPDRLPDGLPGKMTVTQLKGMDAETPEEELGWILNKEPVSVPYIPDFAKEQEAEGITGAARGTVYHKVFERIDYAALKGDGPEEAEAYAAGLLARLCKEGVFSEAEAGAVKPADIAVFLTSPIGLRMKAAALRNELKREQVFTFSIPASEADPSWPGTEELLAQGVIDAYFPEDGAYVIVDYKTDQVSDDGSSLVDKYARQVYYYARALEAATGIRVKEKQIYSVSLGKAFSCD